LYAFCIRNPNFGVIGMTEREAVTEIIRQEKEYRFELHDDRIPFNWFVTVPDTDAEGAFNYLTELFAGARIVNLWINGVVQVLE
jgi:hypothetical protein